MLQKYEALDVEQQAETLFRQSNHQWGYCASPVYDRTGAIVTPVTIDRDSNQDQGCELTKQELLKSLELRAKQQEAVAFLGQQALAHLNLSELMETIVNLVTQVLQVDYSKLLELLPGGHAFLLKAGVGWPIDLIGHATVSANYKSQAGYTCLLGKSVIVEDLRLETRFSGTPLLHNHRIISGLSVIIGNRNAINFDETTGIWGVLSVHTTKLRKFSQDDVYFLESIANVLAAAIERHKSEERLLLMEWAINSTTNGIVITDPTQKDNPIVFVNPGFEKITGYSQAEVLGKNCRFLQKKYGEQTGLDELRSAIIEGRSHQVVLANVRRDGTEFWNELSVSPVYNSRNHLIYFVGIQNDITERKLAEAELLAKSESLATFSLHLKQLHRIATCEHQSIPEMLADYLLAGCEMFGLNIGIVSELQPELEQILIKAVTSNLANLGNLQVGMKVNLADTYAQFSLVAKQTIAWSNSGKIPPKIAQVKSIIGKLESYISTPIFVNGNVYGVLNFGSHQPRHKEFASHDQETIELMAQGMGRFIAANQLEKQKQEAIFALQESEERYRNLVELSPEAIGLYAQGKLVYINTAGATLLGANTPQELLGKNVLDFVHPDSRQIVKERMGNAKQEGEQTELIEHKLVRLDGEIKDVEIAGIPATYQGQIATQLIVRDITERKRAQEQLLHEAFHDALTGLPNRALFIDRVKQALARSHCYQDYNFAVLFLDLDRFKVVNDSLGHTIGDQLLKALAIRLSNCILPADTVARLGGDEFTILLDNIPSFSHVITVAEKIKSELAQPFNLDNNEVIMTASMGIVINKNDNSLSCPINLGKLEPKFSVENPPKDCCIFYQEPEELLRDADLAMYRAKELGKSRYEIFDLAMHDQTLTLLELELDLRKALRYCEETNLPSPELFLYYQPIICLKTEKITGFEALIRWKHPQRGMISPAQFIPIAEETGLIVSLGMWVLREACQQLKKWQEIMVNLTNLTISVNLSGKQILHPNLLEQIDQVLQETGCNPRNLKLEITESTIVENVALATQVLGQIKARKISLCLDDFGTGYSSLSYLHRFPINILKIDRSFVSRLDSPEASSALTDGQPLQIVRAIASLAQNLDLEVVAEGIETTSQLQQIRSLGCEYGQGFYFSKALDSIKATQLLLDSFNL